MRQLSACNRKIAELEAIDVDERTTADELLLARYRARSRELAGALLVERRAH